MHTSRSRSRSPLQLDSPNAVTKSPSLTHSKSTFSGNEHVVDCKVLHLSNLPVSWKHEKIKEFLKNSCKSKTVAETLKYVFIVNEDPGVFLVKFSTSYICNMALTELTGTEIDGKKVDVQFDTENRFRKRFKSGKPEFFKRVKPKQSRQGNSVESNNRRVFQDPEYLPENSDNLETYGLSPSFLGALNIRPPLLSKIFIANLDNRVNETKLREVFGSAGQIINVMMIHKFDKNKIMAKIDFDHPVEAVQAISMFHNQELFNKPMTVHMDNAPRVHLLPEGLSGRGPGLGNNGEPLKGVRTHVELQALKQMVMQSLNNPSDQPTKDQISTAPKFSDVGITQQTLRNPVLPVNVAPFPQTLLNPLGGLTSVLHSQGLQSLQILQSLLQQNCGGDLHSTLAALQGQATQPLPNVVQKQAEWSTQSHNSSRQTEVPPAPTFYSKADDISMTRQQTFDDNRKKYNDTYRYDDHDRDTSMQTGSADVVEPRNNSSDMLIFNNLPSSVNLQALTNKMREVGDLKFAEVTGQGRALVRFYSEQDAKRCVKLFDRSTVDGQTIEVRFF